MYPACMVTLNASAHVCYLCKNMFSATGANYVPPVFPILSFASQFQYPSPAVFSSAFQFQHPSPAVFPILSSAFKFQHPSPVVEPVSLPFVSLWFMVHKFYNCTHNDDFLVFSQET